MTSAPSRHLTFRHNFNFSLKLSDLTKKKPIGKYLILKSPIFATNYNGFTYDWLLEIWQVNGLIHHNIGVSLCYIDGPKNEFECNTTYRIVENVSKHESVGIDTRATRGGPSMRCGHGPFEQSLNRACIDNIKITVDIVLSIDLFESETVLLPSITSNTMCSTPQIEKLLTDAVSGKKCIGYYTIRCDGGDLYVDPNLLINTNDYFKSKIIFQTSNQDGNNVIDLSHIRKERMIDLITYIYTGRISLPNDGEIESSKELLESSEMLLMVDVKNACKRRLVQELIKNKGNDIGIAADLLVFADKHSLDGLKSIAMSIVADRIDELAKSKDEAKVKLYKSLKKDQYKEDGSETALIDQIVEHIAQRMRCQLIDD